MQSKKYLTNINIYLMVISYLVIVDYLFLNKIIL
jgi:hypothetical protein